MTYNINTINEQIERRITINDKKINSKIGKIKQGDILILNKNNDENKLIKILNAFEKNWFIDGKKTLIYNVDEQIKIENYIYAVTMQREVPNDLYDDIINQNPEIWNKYKKLLTNKPLYIQRAKPNCIANNINNAKNAIGDIDLIIAIEKEVNDSIISRYCWNVFTSALVIITDKVENAISKNNISILDI